MVSDDTFVGSISGLWRYAVKSLQGEALQTCGVTTRGFSSDRQFAVRNRAGKFGSGKSTRRFQRMDGLLGFGSQLDDEVPVVRFPDGRCYRGDGPLLDAELSAVLGQEVSLAREAAVKHFDQSPIHILSSSSLDWLSERLPDAEISPQQFRPNILVETLVAGRVEEMWVGRTIIIGSALRLKITHRTERCVMVNTLANGSGKDSRMLKMIAAENDACFGVYADVITPGLIVCGDPVKIIDAAPTRVTLGL